MSSTWDEIQDVFGDGHDYDWALEDDEQELADDVQKMDMKYRDVSLTILSVRSLAEAFVGL